MKRLLSLCGIWLLLLGCSHHVAVQPPTNETWRGPIYAPDHSYGYFTNDHGEWIVISKVGPQKAVKDLCPHSAVCLIEDSGEIYRIKRGN